MVISLQAPRAFMVRTKWLEPNGQNRIVRTDTATPRGYDHAVSLLYSLPRATGMCLLNYISHRCQSILLRIGWGLGEPWLTNPPGSPSLQTLLQSAAKDIPIDLWLMVSKPHTLES